MECSSQTVVVGLVPANPVDGGSAELPLPVSRPAVTQLDTGAPLGSVAAIGENGTPVTGPWGTPGIGNGTMAPPPPPNGPAPLEPLDLGAAVIAGTAGSRNFLA